MITQELVQQYYPTKPLGEVVQFLDSRRRPVTASERRPGPYPYYGANGKQGTIDGYIFDEPLVLLAEDGGHFENPQRGIAYQVSGKTWVNNHAHVLRPSSNIDIDFLARVLENYDATPFITGTTRSKLTKAGASRILVPIPSLPEQRQVAAVLDQADELRTKRREVLAQLDDLIESIFLSMFADLNLAGWKMATVADIAAPEKGSIRTGPFGSQLLHEEFVDEGTAVLGIDNAVENEFRWNDRRFISQEKYKQLRRYTVRPGDVLITIMGTCGRCAIVPDDIPIAINTKHLCCITLDQEKCLPAFLHAYFLKHPVARRYLTQKAKGAIMSGLNMEIIKALPIPLAPIGLQYEFARSVDTIERLRDRQRIQLAESDALFASLQYRAFRGELVR